jgi:hypothetical protein
VTVRAQLAQSEIYLGESVGLEVRVEGLRDPLLPDLQHPAMEIMRQGGQNFNNSSVTIINGQTTRSEEFGYVGRYLLRPHTAGVLEIPPITITQAGQTYRSQALTLVVRQPEAQDRLFVEVTTEKPAYVIGESVTITLNVSLRKLTVKGNVLDTDPFFREQPPHLDIPWFESLGDWKTAPIDTFVQPFLVQQRPGFTINSYVDNRSLLGRSLLDFTLPRQSTTRTTPEGPAAYFTYQLRKQFRPVRPGIQNIPPVVVKATLPIQVDERGRALQSKKMIASSAPLTVTIRPVPSTGQPATFSGAVGRFQLTVEAQPTLLKVGDPLTLTLTLRGEGDSLLETAHAPALHEQAALTQDFKVQSDLPEIRSSDAVKVFTYTIRPRHAQARAVPSIEVAYFDPGTGSFHILHSPPIPIRVEAANPLSVADVITTPASTIPHTPGQELSAGILANYTGPDVLVPQMGRLQVTPGLVILGGLPPLAYVLTCFGRRRVRQRRQDSGRRRARQAGKRALSVLQALEARPEASGESLCNTVHRVLIDYIGDKFHLYHAGLTVEDVLTHLQTRHLQQDLRDQLAAVLQLCDSARYAPGSLAVAQLTRLLADARAVIEALETRGRP